MLKHDEKQFRRSQEQPGPDENLVCEACGRFGAFHMVGRAVCETCYSGCGSCCPEFGKDDLWAFAEAPDDSSETGRR